MGKDRFKKIYECLLESEELYIMFPGMSGNWEKDEKNFIKAQKELEEVVEFKDVYLEDDSEDI